MYHRWQQRKKHYIFKDYFISFEINITIFMYFNIYFNKKLLNLILDY